MIFILIGSEALLVRRVLEKLLKEKVDPATRDFNFDAFEGAEVQAQRLADVTGTLPVLASRRVILIRNAHEIKKGEFERLEALLKNLPETTDLIFVAEKLDRRLGFWQKAEKLGKLQEFKSLYPKEAAQWIRNEASSKGFQMEAEAADWLVEAVGVDLSLLSSTLEKLILLKKGDKRISLGDVESTVTAFSWKSVFDLMDAVGAKDLKRALLLFNKMSASGESPIGMVSLLARHFRILTRLKEGSQAGVSPYFLQQYQRQAQAFKKEELEKKREKIFEADRSLKSSPIPNTLLFERLLIDLCR